MSGAYGPRMLEHARNPRNRGRLDAPSVSQDGTNMSCGDRMRIELDIDGDVITDARFTAKACSICVASASALTELVRGAPFDDVATLTVGELAAQLGTDIRPSRLPCVSLPLTVLHAAIVLYRRQRG
ncbi:MAG TPA: iron-sulfur cluster assembly scaffold protein [Gemmatimonadaceae bacterium]|nr:iron-sulfur cluster assembly scaffold protein [Gemmatimonadaceae bacterium]